MKKMLKKFILLFYPIIKRLPSRGRTVDLLKHKFYLLYLINKGDFLSEIEYNIAVARRRGAIIGKNCRMIGGVTFNDEPYLVEIGDNVRISGEVKFITHDGGVYNFVDDEHKILGNYGKIKIGNNVFIGMRTMILPNVEIGNNCIIGAGAVVMDSFPDNSVIMGNPARLIYKTSLYKMFKLKSKTTLYDEKYHYPYEEMMPKEYKKELLINKLRDAKFKKRKNK